MDTRVISIGTLAMHPLWGEKVPVRTGHMTCSLVRCDDMVLLVDPGLPEQAITARLAERSGLTPGDITHVFLTRFLPDSTRGIMAFPDATWWISPIEREVLGVAIAQELRRAHDAQQQDLVEILSHQVALLRRCEPAPDALCAGVSVFPMPGVTQGACGLLLAEALGTTLICGDAIATIEHLEAGRVLERCTDVDRARESLAEGLEIADWLVLGRDNAVVNRVAPGPF